METILIITTRDMKKEEAKAEAERIIKKFRPNSAGITTHEIDYYTIQNAVIHVKGILKVLSNFMVVEGEGGDPIDFQNTKEGKHWKSILTQLEKRSRE